MGVSGDKSAVSEVHLRSSEGVTRGWKSCRLYNFTGASLQAYNKSRDQSTPTTECTHLQPTNKFVLHLQLFKKSFSITYLKSEKKVKSNPTT